MLRRHIACQRDGQAVCPIRIQCRGSVACDVARGAARGVEAISQAPPVGLRHGP
jgi:hypothetical protein